MKIKNTVQNRSRMLIVGVLTMLFAGVIYAWSILKVPFAQELLTSHLQCAFSVLVVLFRAFLLKNSEQKL